MRFNKSVANLSTRPRDTFSTTGKPNHVKDLEFDNSAQRDRIDALETENCELRHALAELSKATTSVKRYVEVAQACQCRPSRYVEQTVTNLEHALRLIKATESCWARRY
jgi:hypothetical protein